MILEHSLSKSAVYLSVLFIHIGFKEELELSIEFLTCFTFPDKGC